MPPHLEPPHAALNATNVRYAVMRFDDRNRYGKNGVPANLLFSGGQRVVVWMKDATLEKAGKRNRFAKVVLGTEKESEAELVELLGEVGDYTSELAAYQLHFGLKPCRYPKPNAWNLLPMSEPPEPGRLDCTSLHVFSVDNPGTRDIDDALSLTPVALAPACLIDVLGDAALHAPAGALILGIHVSDVASRVPPSSPLYAWAQVRVASAYHGGIGDDEGQRGGSVPMMPPQLAHDELSLNQGVPRNAVSLFLLLTSADAQVLGRAHARTRLVNGRATSYGKFGQTAKDVAAGAHRAAEVPAEEVALRECEAAAARLLSAISGHVEPEELVAYTMIEYNGYFGAMLKQLSEASLSGAAAEEAGSPAGLLRAQYEAGVAAAYAFAPSVANGLPHASLGLVNYAHCSSPIRRYADLHNQQVLFGSLRAAARAAGGEGVAGVVDDPSLEALNARVTVLAQYHARVDAMELAYRCKDEPMLFRGKVCLPLRVAVGAA